jgi:hypothetical protein
VLSGVIKPEDAALFLEIDWKPFFDDCTNNQSPENAFTSFKNEIKG